MTVLVLTQVMHTQLLKLKLLDQVVLSLLLKWVSQSRKLRSLLSHVLLKLNTHWNLLRILKPFMVWMLKLSWLTFFQQRSWLKSTVKLSVQSTHKLRQAQVSLTQQSMVSSTCKQMQTVVGQLRSSKV